MTEFSSPIQLPVLPLRDIVVFPHMIVPLFVGREKSVKALEEVMNEGKQIILLTQTDAAIDEGRQQRRRDGLRVETWNMSNFWPASQP